MRLFKEILNLFLFFIFILFVLLSCDDSLTINDVDKRDMPLSNVSFSKDLYPVFQVKCIYCHNATNPDGGLDLTTHAAATSSLDMIFPGEAELSRIVWAIEARSGISPMPPIGYPVLTQKQITGIKTWINEGAKNN